MPFNFKKFDLECQGMTVEELHSQWHRYTRQISSSATSTAVSGLAIPFTAGLSTVGLAIASSGKLTPNPLQPPYHPTDRCFSSGIHNARKKRKIIEAHLNERGTTHHTRKRDVLPAVAFSGALGVSLIDVSGSGADFIIQQGCEAGKMFSETAVNVAIEPFATSAGMLVEHSYSKTTDKISR